MTKRKTSVTQIAPAISVEKIEQMAVYRKDELITHNKELKAEDFASEAEYREALISQYENLRREEYRYTVQNEALKAYNLTCDGRNAGVKENNAWDAYAAHPDIVSRHTEHADSAQVQQFPKICEGMHISGKAMNNHKNIDKKTGQVKSVGAYSCAITASAMQMQISDKMGYCGKDNIIQPSRTTPLASAELAATCVDKKYQQQGDGKTTLNDMVMQGKVGVGDEVSIVSANGATVKTASGKHSMTVAAINRNDNGEVTSYVLQANNVCVYETIYPNDSDKNSHGKRVVYNTVKTHEWADDKITKEAKGLENLSTEELTQKVGEQRSKTEAVIDNLAVNENYATTHKTNNGRGVTYLSTSAGAYMQEYKQLERNYQIRRQEPMIFASNMNGISVMEMIGEIKIPTRLEIKGDYFDAHVDGKEQTAEAQKENERIAQNAQEQTDDKTNTPTQQTTKDTKAPQPQPTKQEQKPKEISIHQITKTQPTTTKPREMTVPQLVEALKKRSR